VVAKLATGLAALDMAAEALGAARLNRPHCAILHRNETVCGLISRPKAREDLCEFYLTPCRIRALRMRAHGALAVRGVGRFEQIEWRVGARQVLLRQVKVARRGGEAAVSEQALDGVHVGAGFE
jgi:hypothetical protein